MNDLRIFKFNHSQIRTVEKDGQVWFVLKDVCDVLDIDQVAGAKRRLSDDVISNHPIPDAIGRQQNTLIINEDGLYDVIFESRKPEARAFRKWVTSEVLPSIRKSGSYRLPQMSSVELIAALANQAVEQERKMKALEDRVSETVETITTIQETFLQHDDKWRDSVNTMINGAAFRFGGTYRDLRSKSYEILEERARCDLKTRLRNLIERMEASGATKTQLRKASRMDVIEADPRLKEIYSTVVKELSISSLRVAK